MILIDDVYKSFGNLDVVKGLSLEVEQGEKIAIIGRSGCGKSTILRVLLGLIRPDHGDVFIDGINLSTCSEEELMKVRSDIGLLFQSAALFDSMNVEENVGFALRHGKERLTESEIAQKVFEKLEMVEMLGFEKQMTSKLSGGQRKRIGLARALVSEPKVMLYDEPTTGLDPILSTSIEDLIVSLSDRLNVTSIVVTHQRSTIRRTADKIYFMHEGALLPPETPQTIYESTQEIYKTFYRGAL